MGAGVKRVYYGNTLMYEGTGQVANDGGYDCFKYNGNNIGILRWDDITYGERKTVTLNCSGKIAASNIEQYTVYSSGSSYKNRTYLCSGKVMENNIILEDYKLPRIGSLLEMNIDGTNRYFRCLGAGSGASVCVMGMFDLASVAYDTDNGTDFPSSSLYTYLNNWVYSLPYTTRKYLDIYPWYTHCYAYNYYKDGSGDNYRVQFDFSSSDDPVGATRTNEEYTFQAYACVPFLNKVLGAIARKNNISGPPYNITSAQLNDFVFGTTESTQSTIWLMNKVANETNRIWTVDGVDGCIYYDFPSSLANVRPEFNISIDFPMTIVSE